MGLTFKDSSTVQSTPVITSLILNFLGDVPMFERRALERIKINQPALLHVDGIRGCHPCLGEISTVTAPCFIHLPITLPPSNFICH